MEKNKNISNIEKDVNKMKDSPAKESIKKDLEQKKKKTILK